MGSFLIEKYEIRISKFETNPDDKKEKFKTKHGKEW